MAGDDVAAVAELAATFDAVDAALRRIDGHRYGRCTRCGGEVADAELALDPLALACADHPPASATP